MSNRGKQTAPLSPGDSDKALRLLHEVRNIQRERDLEVNRLTAKIDTEELLDCATQFDELVTCWWFEGGAHQGSLPQAIGRFKIIRQLGYGGFARVFLAHDEKINRQVALKVPNLTAMASVEARERFAREAHAAGILSHPNIIAVYENGNIGPVSYIAYEYCDGPTLSEWFVEKSKSISAADAASIVARLADAVEHAHQRGIIHRDLKPANVLLEVGQGSEANRVRITDFGLAKSVKATESVVTTEGAIVGTPAYMSPEQARGSNELGAATDIYSLAVILYELLTGKLPFLKSSHIETLLAIENQPIVSLCRLNQTVARDLEAICLKGMNKEPAKRYSSAHDLAEDLYAWIDGRSVKARHATTIEKTIRWTNRNPKLATAFVFAATCFLIGTAVSGWQWYLKQNSLVEVDTQRQRAQRNVKRLANTIETVIDEFAGDLRARKVLSDGQKNSLRELLSIQGQMVKDEARLAEVNTKTVQSLLDIANVYQMLGDYQEADDTCDRAIALVGSATDSNPEFKALQRLQVAMLVRKSNILFDDSKYTESENAIHESIALMTPIEQVLRDSKQLEMWYDIYRQLANFQGRLAAMESQRKTIEIADKLLAIDDESFHNQTLKANGLKNLAWYYRRDKRPERIQLFLDAIHYFEQVNIDDVEPRDSYVFRHHLANTRSQASRLLLSERRYDETFEQLNLAFASFDQLLQENPRDSAVMTDRVTTMVRICSYYLESKQTEGLLEKFPEWIAAAESLTENRFRARWSNWFRLRFGRLLVRANSDYDAGHAQLDRILESAPLYLENYDNEIVILRDLTGAATSKAEWKMNEGEFEAASELATLGAKYNDMLLAKYPNAKLVAPATTNRRRAIFLARLHGLKFVVSGDLITARKLIVDRLKVDPDSPQQHYVCARNLAKCSQFAQDFHTNPIGELALEIRLVNELAIKHLQVAVELGFQNQRQIENDDAWALLRGTAPFQSVFKQLLEKHR